MRDFNERKAEILRRSKKRIKQRKRNRNRALACCIPICLCAIILSIIYLPDVLVSNDKLNFQDIGDIYVSEENGLVYGDNNAFAYTQLEIRSNEGLTNHYQEITDASRATQIFSFIQNLYNADTSDGKNHSYASKDENKSSADSIEPAYTIIFTDTAGGKTIYLLTGNKLKIQATSQTLVLTDEQLSELKSNLGLLK